MKNGFRITLLCISFCFLTFGTGFAQLGADDCFDREQVCHDCMCIMVYDPVCGCNGQTYSNSCFAYIAGITSWTEGPCRSYSSAVRKDDQLWFFSPVEQEVVLRIYDREGKLVASPLRGMAQAGKEYRVAPDLPAGTYFCRVTNGTQVLNKQLVIR